MKTVGEKRFRKYDYWTFCNPANQNSLAVIHFISGLSFAILREAIAILIMYSVYSTGRFRHAPVAKLWTGCTFMCSCALIPFSRYRVALRMPFSALDDLHQYWRLVLSRVPFLDSRDIIAGCLLLYSYRLLERRYGSRKFFSFLVICGFLNLFLELVLFYALSQQGFLNIQHVPCGPYSVIFSCFLLFVLDIPWVTYMHIWRIPLSQKLLPYLFAFQLFVSSPAKSYSAICGMITALLYRSNFLHIQDCMNFIPVSVSGAVSCLLGPLIRFGEDRTGQVLPIGATSQIQRQEIMDRLEQQMIMSQIRLQHRQDQAVGRAGLLAARRWFGNQAEPAPAVQQRNNVNPTEDMVRALMDMGFGNRQQIVDALQASNNDINNAAHVLLQAQHA